MDEPQLRLFMQDSVPPAGWYFERPGRWVAEPEWPSPNVSRTRYRLGVGGTLGPGAGDTEETLTHRSPLWVGMGSGKWCGYSVPGDAPLDQRCEDAGSLCFETPPLEAPLEIAGDANVVLKVSVDRPAAVLAARLCDVAPDGASTRVSFGVFNLTHRNGHEHPEALEPDRPYRITIPMKHVAQSFAAGHRLRLALSTSYFPMIWTSPEPVVMTLHTADSCLDLPLRAPDDADRHLAPFPPAKPPPPSDIEELEAPDRFQRILTDAATGRVEMQIGDGHGRLRFCDSDLVLEDQGAERFSVQADDPNSARGETEWRFRVSRGDWSISTMTETVLTSDKTNFIISARLRAWEGEELLDAIAWQERIPREGV